MASPQRQYPDKDDLASDPRPALQQPSPAAPPSTRRWRYGYSWILLALILGIWYVGFGWGNSGGWIWGHRGDATAESNSGDLNSSGLVILEVANKQDYIGQAFQIQDVAVDHWSGDRAVWIGSRHSYLPMLLVFPAASALAPKTDGGASSPAMNAGADGAKAQHLDVTGKVMKAPPTAQAQQQWKLSDEDVDQLEEEGVYILATAVHPGKQ